MEGDGGMKWEKIAIKDVCIGIYDGPHATPPISDSGAIFLGISNFTNGRLDLTNVRYIAESDFLKWTKRVVPKAKDIVFSYEATLNLYAIIPEGFRGCLGRRMCLLRVDENKVYYKFLFYYFYSNAWKAIIKENTVLGATVNRIPLIKFPNFQIELPPIETQRRIADILSAYDDLIENNRKQIKLLEEAAQRLYKEWFVDLHFPSYKNTKIVDGVPEGWKKGSLKTIIQILSGFAFKSTSFDKIGKYKIVTIKNVQDGVFDGNNVNNISDIPNNMPQYCFLNNGDILLSLTGNVGRVCLVQGENYLLNQRVAKLKTEYIAFAYCLFRSRGMFIEMNNLANGVAQQNLSPIKTGEIQILVPHIDIILKFENIAIKYIQNMICLEKQIAELTQARDRLLPKLMSGEVEV